jgi:hypothetical protein
MGDDDDGFSDDGGYGLHLGIGEHHAADDGGHHDQGGLRDKNLNDMLLLGVLTGNGPLKNLTQRKPAGKGGAGCGCALPMMTLVGLGLLAFLL